MPRSSSPVATETAGRAAKVPACDVLECDVAIVGAGPTGLTLANLLGCRGIRAVVIERNASTVREPRAVTMDDETLRTMQAAGLLDEVTADLALDCGSYFLGPDGVPFAKVHPTSREFGFPRRNSFSQVLFEATLRRGLDRFAGVTALFGHACAGIAESEDGVVVEVRRPDGGRLSVRAAYAVGCDGGKSMLRDLIGASLGGATYEQRWIVIDLGTTREALRHTRIFCDPARPGITLPGPHGTRRYEFMLHASEAAEAAEGEAFVRGLMRAHGPDGDARILRTRVYTFHARVADRWQTRRMFIAGDAAHLSPPFGGLGMNSCIRDANNLAWKLAEVVAGRLPEGLLQTYSVERMPHAAALVQTAINIGQVMMPTSRWKAMLIRNGLRLAGVVPSAQQYFAQMKYRPKPYYRAGFLLVGDESGRVGRLMPQPSLDCAGSLRRLDDIVGPGFGLLAYGREAERFAAAAGTADFGVPVSRVAILPAEINPSAPASPDIAVGRDAADLLADRRRPPAACALLLIRPDRHVAAAADLFAVDRIAPFAAKIRGLVSAT